MRRKTENRDAFSKVERRHSNRVASPDYAHVNNSIIYIATHKRNAPINMLSCSKAPNTQQVEHFQHPRKPAIFSVVTSRYAMLAPVKLVSYLSSLAKVFISVRL